MESISRISSMLDTGLGIFRTCPRENKLTANLARDLTLEAAQSMGSARIVNSRPSNRDLPVVQVKRMLDSRNDREVLDGLRKVISV